MHHLSIARGSVAELETLLEASALLGYLDAADIAPALSLADEVRRMLGAMIVRLRMKAQLRSES